MDFCVHVSSRMSIKEGHAINEHMKAGLVILTSTGPEAEAATNTTMHLGISNTKHKQGFMRCMFPLRSDSISPFKRYIYMFHKPFVHLTALTNVSIINRIHMEREIP